MASYVKIAHGVVVQKQPYRQKGFIEAPDTVVCGYLFDGTGFSSPDDGPSADAVRRKRDSLLFETDPWMASDRDLSDGQLSNLLSYRKNLREVPQQGGFPKNVAWPEKPSWM